MTTDEQRRRYVLVIPVPREIEIRIEDRFLGLSGVTKPLMGYHITLLGSFLLPEGFEPQSIPQIQQICTMFEPFDVFIGGIGAFERPDNHAIYITVLESAPIKELQQALWQTLRHNVTFANEGTRAWNMPANFHPHVTLGIGLTNAEHRAFMDSGTDKDCAASFTVTQINLVAQDSEGPWQVVTHYKLGRHPKPSSNSKAY